MPVCSIFVSSLLPSQLNSFKCINDSQGFILTYMSACAMFLPITFFQGVKKRRYPILNRNLLSTGFPSHSLFIFRLTFSLPLPFFRGFIAVFVFQFRYTGRLLVHAIQGTVVSVSDGLSINLSGNIAGSDGDVLSGIRKSHSIVYPQRGKNFTEHRNLQLILG